ncbi:hypothetical protein WJX74_002296 [Apatococcus lobatus]|uniref:Uncharacterized protein n=1 Tax=Apatococcus lobatus TaxID=904363 RepID=A0AAW1S3M8_9CHLO
MVSNFVTACLLLACLAGSTVAQSVVVPVNGHEVPVAGISNPETAPTSQGDEPSVAKPDQTFSADYFGVHGKVGVADGVPEHDVSVNPAGTEHAIATNTDPSNVQTVQGVATGVAGKRRHLLGRRLLQAGALDLSGDGVSVGDSEAGLAAKGYGHGTEGDSVVDPHSTHIQPHGVDVTATQGGQATSVGGEANPDCVGTIEGYNEGPDCVGIIGK